MNRSLRRAAGAGIAIIVAVSLAACAGGPHTPDDVCTIVAREAAPKASPLKNVGVVAIVDHFKLGRVPNDSALVANGNERMDTLMPAILARVPGFLARDAIYAQAVPFVPGHPETNARELAQFDYVMEFTPASVSQQKNVAEPSLILNVRVLNHALQPVWVARVELRTDALPAGRRDDIRQWREAMADDLAGLLLRQLGQDGFVVAPTL